MTSSRSAAAFLQGELKKQGKKESQAKPARKPARSQPNQPESQPGANQTSQKASQEPSQTSQKPSQTSQKASQKASRKPSQASQKPTKKASQEGRSPCRNKGSCWAFCQTAYLGVIILQPHACTQRFRLRRTRSNAGRMSARSLSGRIEPIWETPSKERGAMFCVRTFARRSLQLSLQSLRSSRSSRLRNSTRNSTRAAAKKWLVPVSSRA